MNFIIPKNYKFKPKLLGIIDYQTAILNAIWAGFLYLLVNLFFHTLSTKVYCFAGLFLPFSLFSIIGMNNENMISVIVYILKFYLRQKIFLFRKQ